MYRDCYIIDCIEKIDQKIKIAGWVNKKRDHGGLLFIDLRDHTGIIQIVCTSDMDKIPTESVIKVEGKIKNREDNQINQNISTGFIELVCEKYEILSKSSPLPFEINNNINDELKIKHRNLYLRSEKMQRNIRFRAEFIQFLRKKMIDMKFCEVQTPLITSSSPEGATDFVIPSRLHPGMYYALPQAPQIFKQLLMTSCFDKYFQIAPCFRDEDARSDRCYGEFYQLDCEMSFVTQDEVLNVITPLISDFIFHFKKVRPTISRMTYEYSMEKYASDKPDLRNPLEITNYCEIFKNSEMDLFRNQIIKGNVVKGIKVPANFGKSPLNNSSCKTFLDQIDRLHKFKTAYIIKQEGEIKGPIAKFVDNNLIDDNEIIFFVCDTLENTCKKLDIIRNFLAEFTHYELNPQDFRLIEIVDFPMFEQDEKSKTGWGFKHNPFSKPLNFSEEIEDLSLVKANQYDLVLNGVEILSGSIRNTDVNTIIKCFEKVGYAESEVRQKFNSIISGFSYGV
ncbi:MAG: aspartate--tRNA ligase, partial [Bacteroidota bacterium]